jgi:hypothetical protein
MTRATMAANKAMAHCPVVAYTRHKTLTENKSRSNHEGTLHSESVRAEKYIA